MSDVADASRINIILADYAAAGTDGKLNVLGGGVMVVGYDPQVGTSAPISVAVEIWTNPDQYDEEFSFELVLLNRAGDVVDLPGPAGPQAMRIGHIMNAAEPKFPGRNVPKGFLPARSQIAVHFANGLPLVAGESYVWSVRIDGEGRPDWDHRFYVSGPPPAPVIG